MQFPVFLFGGAGKISGKDLDSIVGGQILFDNSHKQDLLDLKTPSHDICNLARVGISSTCT
jgi:hypothetical protein